MKTNNYIQPVVEVTSVQTMYTVLSESNPFQYGGGSPSGIDGDPV